VLRLALALALLAGCAADDVPAAADAGECGSPGEPCCPAVVPEDQPCNHTPAVCVEGVCVAPPDGGP
jgi:hypothetical protein